MVHCKQIRNKALDEALRRKGIFGIELIKDDGYFWLAEADERNHDVKDGEASIYVNAFSHMPISWWADEIESRCIHL